MKQNSRVEAHYLKGSSTVPVGRKSKPESKKRRSPAKELIVMNNYGQFNWTCPQCGERELGRAFEKSKMLLLKHLRENHSE